MDARSLAEPIRTLIQVNGADFSSCSCLRSQRRLLTVLLNDFRQQTHHIPNQQEERPCFVVSSLHWQRLFSSAPVLSRTTRSRAVEVAVGTEAVEAFTAAAPELEAFTEVAPSMRVATTAEDADIALEVRARHIPSQAAPGVPDIQLPVVPVVRATRSQAAPVGVLSISRIRCGGGGCRSGWCRVLWQLWRLQQLLRCVRQLDLSRTVSLLTRAKRSVTPVNPSSNGQVKKPIIGILSQSGDEEVAYRAGYWSVTMIAKETIKTVPVADLVPRK